MTMNELTCQAGLSRLRTAVTCLMVVVLAFTAGAGCAPRPEAAIGLPAPDFALPDLHGTTIALADFRGQAVLLNFWATWCESCKEELPLFQSLLDAYGDSGLVVVLVSVGDDPAKVADFMAGQSFSLIALTDTRQETGPAFQTNALPKTFLIDAQGVVRAIRIGPFKDWEALVEEVEPLLPRPAKTVTPTPPPSPTISPALLVPTNTADVAATITRTVQPSSTLLPSPTVSPTLPPTPTATLKPRPTFTPVAPSFGLSLIPAETALSGPAGALVVFNVTIENTGSVADTFDISILKMLPGGWQAMYCIDDGCYLDGVQAVSLQAGEKKAMEVKVISAPDSVSGQSGAAVLLAASQGDPLLGASVAFTLSIP